MRGIFCDASIIARVVRQSIPTHRRDREADQKQEPCTHTRRVSTACQGTPFMSRTSLSTVLAGAAIAAAVPTASQAMAAEQPSPVDVALHDAPPPRRVVTIEWNPLALFIDRLSANVVIVPRDHHGLVLSPFYTWASTAPYSTQIDGQGNTLTDASGNPVTLNVLRQTFKGFGGELGYRYYFGSGGPRGLFVGPSILLSSITATAGNGSQTSFIDFGVAADVGFQALLADCVALSVGAGLEYSAPSQSIPDQQLPAAIVANSGVRPRLLLSVGYAF